MSEPEASVRRHGLYYPFFHVRDERWLKVAALYWPRIVRIVPDGYATRDSESVRALVDGLGFIERQPPGRSVEAVAPRFIDLVEKYGKALRAAGLRLDPHFRLVPPTGLVARGSVSHMRAQLSRSLVPTGSGAVELPELRLAAVHQRQMTPALEEALLDAELAISMPRNLNELLFGSSVSGWPWTAPTRREPEEWHGWVMMHEDLVSVYSSVLAEDFATANKLQPTTDQQGAYAVTNNWTSDSIAAALLDRPERTRPSALGEMAEAMAFLALDLVVPANLDAVPIQRIIEIRERYGPEFLAFGAAAERAAAGLEELADIRDQAVLDQYVRDAVGNRFEQPLKDLRRKMKSLRLDATTMAINIKTELPAGIALAGAAWLAGHPLVAGTAAVAVGLMAVRSRIRQQRDMALQSIPGASFLLHTQERLRARGLLDRTLYRLQRIAGTDVG